MLKKQIFYPFGTLRDCTVEVLYMQWGKKFATKYSKSKIHHFKLNIQKIQRPFPHHERRKGYSTACQQIESNNLNYIKFNRQQLRAEKYQGKQTADCLDLVARVFKLNLDSLINELRSRACLDNVLPLSTRLNYKSTAYHTHTFFWHCVLMTNSQQLLKILDCVRSFFDACTMWCRQPASSMHEWWPMHKTVPKSLQDRVVSIVDALESKHKSEMCLLISGESFRIILTSAWNTMLIST